MYINTRPQNSTPEPLDSSSSVELSRAFSTSSSSSSNSGELNDDDDDGDTTDNCNSPLTTPNENNANSSNLDNFTFSEDIICKPVTKARKTCHRCGNIRKVNISCNSCEQIFCKACARKFEEYSGTNFRFMTKRNGCPVCLKLCCCGNSKGHECTSKFHCYRRCEISRKTSKRRPTKPTGEVIETKRTRPYVRKESASSISSALTPLDLDNDYDRHYPNNHRKSSTRSGAFMSSYNSSNSDLSTISTPASGHQYNDGYMMNNDFVCVDYDVNTVKTFNNLMATPNNTHNNHMIKDNQDMDYLRQVYFRECNKIVTSSMKKENPADNVKFDILAQEAALALGVVEF